MLSEAVIVASYGPMIVTAFTVTWMFGRWARTLRGGKDRAMYHLVLGIALAFVSIMVENTYVFAMRLLDRVVAEGSLVVFSWFWPAILTMKLACLLAGSLHLHAYWMAKNNRSYIKPWLLSAAFWYVGGVIVYLWMV